MRVEYSGFLMLMCALLGGCGVAPSGPLAKSFQQAEPAFSVDPSFQPGMDVLADGDQSHDFDRAAITDWLLLGVKVARPAAQDVWFVRLSTLALENESDSSAAPRLKEFTVPFGMGGLKTGMKFIAPVSRLRVETFDKDGGLIRASIRTVPHVRSNTTLLDVLSGMAMGNELFSENLGTSGDAKSSLPATLTMMQLLGGSKALAPIRDSIADHVVTKPSLLAILLNGLRIKVEAKIEEREMVRSPWSEQAALIPRQEAKFPMLLAGQRLFDCRIVVAPPQPPYHLTAGAVLIEAVHPEHESNRLTVCVLAARHVADDEVPITTVASRQP